jgi:hypothetical protein
VNEALAVVMTSGLLGLIGGMVRGFIGMFKALAVKRKIIWGYWLITAIISGLIGVLLGIVFSFDYRLSVLAGYAGTDILEGIYKSFKTEKVVVVKK